MKVYLVGIAHNDPLCRPLLVSHLRSIAEVENSKPSFVGVEYSKLIFERIKGLREAFKGMIHAKWPNEPEAVIEAMAKTLGFEGDAHEEVFPDAVVVWLDQHRQIAPEGSFRLCDGYDVFSPRNIDRRAENMLTQFSNWLSQSEGKVLEVLRHMDWSGFSEMSKKPSQSTIRRNQKWARLIRQAAEENQNSWGIVISGASHHTGHAESLDKLLAEYEFETIQAVLNPHCTTKQKF